MNPSNIEIFEFVWCKDKIKDHKVEDWMLNEETIKKHLSKMKAPNIRKDMLVFGGHPLGKANEEDSDGYDTLRFDYMDEMSSRGKRMLEELGWTTDLDAIYVNLHVGSKEKLRNLLCSEVRYDESVDNGKIDWEEVWSVVEHWIPFDEESHRKIRIEYLKEELKGDHVFIDKDKINDELKSLGEKIGLLQFCNQNKKV